MRPYDASRFEARLDSCVRRLQQLLEHERVGQLAPLHETRHTWDDKYLQANYLGSVALSALINALELLGVQPTTMRQMLDWSAARRAVTLRFQATENCDFEREHKYDVERVDSVVETSSGLFGASSTATAKTSTTVTEHHFRFHGRWRLLVFAGTDDTDAIVLQERSFEYRLVSSSSTPPKPATRIELNKDASLNFLLQHVRAPTLAVSFEINRSTSHCRTPRRNLEVDSMLSFLRQLTLFVGRVQVYLTEKLLPEERHSYDLSVVNDRGEESERGQYKN